jgi:hypothetical protein
MSGANQSGGDDNGRITTRQFYEALLKVNGNIASVKEEVKNDMASMERRILEKIDCIPGHEAQIDDLQEEVKELRRKSNVWDGLNSVAIVAGTIVGSLFGQK